jgi:hypothetical protein
MGNEMANQPVTPAKQIPVSWAEAASPIFANTISTYCDGATVFLTFGYVDTPLHGPSGGGVVHLDSPRAVPVVRLALPLREFRDTVGTLQRFLGSIDNYFLSKQDKA